MRLDSPENCYQESTTKLAHYFAGHHPRFDSPDLNIKSCFKKLFPNQQFDPQLIYNHVSYLLKAAEQLLVDLHEAKTPVERQIKLAAELRDRGLTDLSQRKVNKLSALLNTRFDQNEEFFFTQYLLAKEKDLAFLNLDRHDKDEALHEKDQHLDHFYLASKLKTGCELLNRANIVSLESDNPILPYIMDYVEQNMATIQKIPAITIYFQIARTLLEPGENAHFNHLKDLLKKHAATFSSNEAKAMYGYAQNYCIKAANEGRVEFLNELFELYKAMLQESFFQQQNAISQWEYKNIVTVATRLKEFEWSEHFIRKFRYFMKPSEAENAYRYNLANLNYSRKLYEEALELLRDVEFTDIYYKLGSRSLLLKIFYEMDETESLFSLLESFKIFVKRSKQISGYQKEIHLNLLKSARKLYRIKVRLPHYRKALLRNQFKNLELKIQEKPQIANVNWLKEKMEEIKPALS